MSRIRLTHAAAVAVAVAVTLLFAPPAVAVDARTEAAAKAAMKKAGEQYMKSAYAAAAALLDRASRACGTTKCSAATRAAVLRDLGTMQVKKGDKTGAAKSFTDALAIVPGLKLNPDYDTSDVRDVFESVGGGTGGGGSGGTNGSGGGGGGGGIAPPAPGQPAGGDFTHRPAGEEKANTPLPVFVQVPEDMGVVRVVVKYKGAQMDDWSRLDLNKVGRGWGGLIPCSQVTTGTMQYWVQGFDQGGEPVAASGDPKHPFTVPIKDDITSEPPHLPGKPAPAQCAEADCPPGSPGCGGAARHHRKPAQDEDTGEGTSSKSDEGSSKGDSDSGGGDEKPVKPAQPAFAKIWLGVAGAVDFISMPTLSDVCQVLPNGQPTNASNMYCTASDGSDFPPPVPAGMQPRTSLFPPKGLAGTSGGGLQIGNARVMLAFDYALNPSLLLGGRFGYVVNAYTGQAAVNAGRAFGAKFHLEARATYLFGDKPLMHPGFAPMVFAGLGASEFDGSTTTFVIVNGGASEPVNAWLTDGPFFFAAGGGVRYQFSLRAAFTANVRLNLAIGGNGVLPTYGPELGLMYGF